MNDISLEKYDRIYWGMQEEIAEATIQNELRQQIDVVDFRHMAMVTSEGKVQGLARKETPKFCVLGF